MEASAWAALFCNLLIGAVILLVIAIIVICVKIKSLKKAETEKDEALDREKILTKEKEKLEKEKKDSQAKSTELQNSLDNVIKVRNSLLDSLSEKETEVAKYKTLVADKNVKITELEDEINSLKKDLISLETDLEEARCALENDKGLLETCLRVGKEKDYTIENLQRQLEGAADPGFAEGDSEDSKENSLEGEHSISLPEGEGLPVNLEVVPKEEAQSFESGADNGNLELLQEIVKAVEAIAAKRAAGEGIPVVEKGNTDSFAADLAHAPKDEDVEKPVSEKTEAD